jgi:NSS family neurotransmitter:Na+ symporter
MLPLGGLLMTIFAGWIMKADHVEEELGLSPLAYRIWRFLIRYITPFAIIAIFMSLLGVFN